MLNLKNGETILFTGDSVTDAGRGRPVGEGLWDGVGNGYVRAVDTMLNAFYPELVVHIINTGSGGNTSRSLLARWDSEVLDLKPDRLFFCIGINDVWRQFDSPGCVNLQVFPEEYEQNLRRMIESAKAQGCQVIPMTPYYMEPNTKDLMRARMDEYGQIVKALSKEYGLVCIDLQKIFDEYLQHRHSSYLMWDRVHPGPVASMLIAGKILKEFGFDRDITV